MSIAEFYIENGIDPSDPNHMDEYLDRVRPPDSLTVGYPHQPQWYEDDRYSNDEYMDFACWNELRLAS